MRRGSMALSVYHSLCEEHGNHQSGKNVSQAAISSVGSSVCSYTTSFYRVPAESSPLISNPPWSSRESHRNSSLPQILSRAVAFPHRNMTTSKLSEIRHLEPVLLLHCADFILVLAAQ